MSKYVDIETKKKLASLTLKWCKKNLGINKRKKIPKISVRTRFIDNDDQNLGSYYFKEDLIVIYHLNCLTIAQVVSTVIHEYTHYLQSMKKYYEFFKTHYYSTNPYERKAERNEKKYTNKCIREIKKQLQ